MSKNSDLIFHGEKHQLTAPFNQQRYNPKRLHKGADYGTFQRKLKQYPILKGVVKRVVTVELNGNQRGLLVDVVFRQIGKGIIHQHLDSILVKPGQTVDRDTALGITGMTGKDSTGKRVSSGIHAHIEVYDLKTGVTEDFEKLIIPEEDEEVEIQKITADMNGRETPLTSILYKGENYVRVRDLADAQTDDDLTVNWDPVRKKVIIKSK